MALDHAPHGIRVNAVSPGLIATPLAAALHEDNRIMGEYARLVPMARAGRAEEIAAAMAFLASADASYITGFNLVVDGGLTAATGQRSEEHTSELQSLMRISYAVFCLKKKNNNT